MKILQEHMALTFKYIYWGLILVGVSIVITSKCFAWGGFTEPLDIHFHPTQSQEEEGHGEKWLAEHSTNNKDDKDDKSTNNNEKDLPCGYREKD